ncbi:MAG: hypothetical protein JW768_15430, partial [Chitinispirillaceae bacterium]|nr:hypothetical protein [Chitinispirillaceae bacterium]
MRTIMTNFTCASVDRRRFVASFVCIITAAVLTHAVAGDAVKDTTEIVRDSANAALVEEAADTALSLQDEQLDTVFTDT